MLLARLCACLALLTKQRLASDPGSVLGADEPRPIRVPPDGVRVPVKAATRSPPEKKSYGDPDSSSLGLDQDALFVLRGIGAPFGFGNHFGIRSRD